MKKLFELKPISIPNLISVKIGDYHDEYPHFPKIKVADLTEKEAIEYAELLRITFLRHWQKLQENPELINNKP